MYEYLKEDVTIDDINDCKSELYLLRRDLAKDVEEPAIMIKNCEDLVPSEEGSRFLGNTIKSSEKPRIDLPVFPGTALTRCASCVHPARKRICPHGK